MYATLHCLLWYLASMYLMRVTMTLSLCLLGGICCSDSTTKFYDSTGIMLRYGCCCITVQPTLESRTVITLS